MTLFEEFSWRGLVYDATAETAEAVKTPLVVYSGFDPTAKSLHVGSLVPLLQLRRCQLFDHTPIVLAGGGTGMIGDPSGKSAERNLQSVAQIEENLAGMEKQLRFFLDFDSKSNPAKFVDNGEWLNKVTMVEFLREIGKNFSVNVMLQKESVKRRLESEDGISYTEFTYSLMQAYDYLELFDRHNCTLQIGGSDQWGNITAGADLIRRKRQGKAHAMVFPLLTTSSGQKFGKTEAGTVWLDPEMTDTRTFGDYWYNTDDRDVGRYLRTFTFLKKETIEELDFEVKSKPEGRVAQLELARAVMLLVHGESALQDWEESRSRFFNPNQPWDSTRIRKNIPISMRKGMQNEEWRNSDRTFFRLVTQSGIYSSGSEARKRIPDGGTYLISGATNWEPLRIVDPYLKIDDAHIVDGNFIIRKGKKEYYSIELLPATGYQVTNEGFYVEVPLKQKKSSESETSTSKENPSGEKE